MRVSNSFLATFATLSLTSPNVTLACETLAPTTHTVDPAEIGVDQTAPDRPVIRLVRLEPGDGWDDPGFEGACVGDAEAWVQIDYAMDDRTDRVDLGFRFILVEGELPKNVYFPREAVRAPGGVLLIMWGVGRSGPIGAVDFTVAVIPVDLAGNDGPASEPIRIFHSRIER